MYKLAKTLLERACTAALQGSEQHMELLLQDILRGLPAVTVAAQFVNTTVLFAKRPASEGSFAAKRANKPVKDALRDLATPPSEDAEDRVTDPGVAAPSGGDGLPTIHRPKDTRFKPGEEWTGNAAGRIKGSKNRITLQRLLAEEELRQLLNVNADQLLVKAIQMALGGSEILMKALLAHLLTVPRETEDATNMRDSQVQIIIKNLTQVSEGATVVEKPAALEHKPLEIKIKPVAKRQTNRSKHFPSATKFTRSKLLWPSRKKR